MNDQCKDIINKGDMLKIGGIKDISTVDYPKEATSVVFTCGCPFRCPYCHNWSFFDPKNCKMFLVKKIAEILQKYSKFTTGIVITGGEPTYQALALVELLKNIQDLGKIKLDTNGSYPKVINKILSLDLVDYIAMDVKAPLEPESYAKVIGRTDICQDVVKRIKKSYELIIKKENVFLEIRTTIVPNLIFKKEDVIKIAREVSEADTITLQQFNPSGGTLNPSFENILSPSRETMIELARSIVPIVKKVQIRTIEGGEEIIE